MLLIEKRAVLKAKDALKKYNLFCAGNNWLSSEREAAKSNMDIKRFECFHSSACFLLASRLVGSTDSRTLFGGQSYCTAGEKPIQSDFCTAHPTVQL